jgi:threo-3-hydroxy-L-aspartate ammonia-lyase
VAAPEPVGLAEVLAAADVLQRVVRRTPVVTSGTLDSWTGGRVSLKVESLQHTGSFKLRGAYHALYGLRERGLVEGDAGVVASSSGNFAQAIARAGRLLGVRVTVVMPRDAPPGKLAATRADGAEIVPYDRYTEDRDAIAAGLAATRGLRLVPPFDDPDVIAGQGTVATELFEQTADLDLLVVPVGGGGLAAGCAAVAAGLSPGTVVVGVEPAVRTAARDALRAGRPVHGEVPRTLLDGQQTTHVGHHPLRVLRRHLDRVVGVTDDAVVRALRVAVERLHLVLEPSGASALAAVLDGTVPVAGRHVGIVLSGGNVGADRLAELLRPG